MKISTTDIKKRSQKSPPFHVMHRQLWVFRFLWATHTETNANKIHNLWALFGISHMFIFMLRRQRMCNWPIRFILILGKTWISQMKPHVRRKMAQALGSPVYICDINTVFIYSTKSVLSKQNPLRRFSITSHNSAAKCLDLHLIYYVYLELVYTYLRNMQKWTLMLVYQNTIRIYWVTI